MNDNSSPLDPTTGLHGRDQTLREVADVCAGIDLASVVLLDVDRLPAASPEATLRAVADALRSVVRIEDAVGRLGDASFALALPGLDEDHALAVAERLRDAARPPSIPGRTLTLSLGVATVRGGAGAGRVALSQAEVALHAAKAMGGDRVRHHRHVLQQSAGAGAGCREACAPSPAGGGCLRCESVPAAPGGAALLLGPHDADAAATLGAVLAAAGFAPVALGPVLVLNDVRGRLDEIGGVLKAKLSPYTRACVQAAYVPSGVATAHQAMAALMFARPLAEMIDHIGDEWSREALADGWLFSVFHPIVDGRTGRTFAQEALLRARRPGDGKVFGAPQIIGACERLNLLHQLDQRARQAAIRGAAQHVPDADTRIFINFLPNTIYDPEDCLRTTMEAAATYGVDMARLVFEVVETERIPDMGQLLRILDYYRDRGVGTAIDDMGAGHTSLDYITALRPDFVKLDREFMLAAEADAAGRARMDEIIRASHAHGARVIAEGIETEAQASMCVGAGVDLLQGFLLAKPACPPQPVAWPASFRRAA